MEENFESTNIHLKWLEHLYKQISRIQDMERMAKEGCIDLMEYLKIPLEMQRVLIPEAQYKNLRFMILEIDILIRNASNILGEKTSTYEKRIKPILMSIDNRNLYLKEYKQRGMIVNIQLLPFFHATLKYLNPIISEFIKDISPILYLDEEKKTPNWR